MSHYGEDKHKHRNLTEGGMSSHQAEDIIRNERARKHHEALVRTMRQGVDTSPRRKDKSSTTSTDSGNNGKPSSNGGELFAAIVLGAVLYAIFNPSANDDTAPPPPAAPVEEKAVMLNIHSPLAGEFICAVQDGKYATTFTSKGVNKIAVSEIDPSLKGRPPINMLGIDIYAKSCKHAEQLINDYYRAFGPK